VVYHTPQHCGVEHLKNLLRKIGYSLILESGYLLQPRISTLPTNREGSNSYARAPTHYTLQEQELGFLAQHIVT